jgi:glutathione peroxidase
MTPQYKQLEELHEKYSEKGLAIVGVPCNQFGGQEPGTAEEIKSFCEKNYGVKFDMLAKVDVNGKSQAELYKYLTSLETNPKGKGDVGWNFEKFVVDRKGNVIARFGSRTKPDSEEFVKVIEGALNQ